MGLDIVDALVALVGHRLVAVSLEVLLLVLTLVRYGLIALELVRHGVLLRSPPQVAVSPY
jgi:hypothetical protein